MSIGAIVAIVIAVIIVVAAGTLAAAEMRRRALRQRFGPEYERLVSEKGARRAGSELTARQRLFARLDIRPLTDEQRAHYTRRWNVAQEQFVDDPAYSVNAASSLVMAVAKDRGYPAGDGDQTMQALSVEHAGALEGYRVAQRVSGDIGGASTEDLRQALLGYRRLFRELTGSSNGRATASTPAPVEAQAPVRAQAPVLVPVARPAGVANAAIIRSASVSASAASAESSRTEGASADDASADDASVDDNAADDDGAADGGREAAEKTTKE